MPKISVSTEAVSFLCPAVLGGQYQDVFKDGPCMSVAPTPYKVIDSLSDIAWQVVPKQWIRRKVEESDNIHGSIMLAFETL